MLRHRRAVHGFQDRPVEPEKIEKVLEAARWAPSGGNTQPWEFVVVTDEDDIVEITEAYVEEYDEKCQESTPDFPVDNKRWRREVPCYIVVLGDRCIREAYPSADIPGEERANIQSYQHSLGDAIYAIWLAATTLGLGTTEATCYSGHETAIRDLLDVPEDYDVVATLSLGYPLCSQDARYRQPIAESVHRGSDDESKYRDDEELEAWLDQ